MKDDAEGNTEEIINYRKPALSNNAATNDEFLSFSLFLCLK